MAIITIPIVWRLPLSMTLKSRKEGSGVGVRVCVGARVAVGLRGVGELVGVAVGGMGVFVIVGDGVGV